MRKSKVPMENWKKILKTKARKKEVEKSKCKKERMPKVVIAEV